MANDALRRQRRTGRRPGENRSRDAIAAAALRQFGARGFDAVTIRAIAQDAGVDPALVLHFFGTKQSLFEGLVQFPIEPWVVEKLLAPGVEGLGERLARFVIGQLRGGEVGEAMVGLLRTAAAHPRAAELLRERYVRDLLEPLAAGLKADRPELRASLCSSQLLGLAVAERIIGLPPLVEAEPDVLVKIYGPTLQRYLTETLPI